MYTLFMTIDDKEYPLFSYKPKDRFPPLSPWTPKENVYTISSVGKCSMEYEFFNWISSVLFPYEKYEDHTDNLKLVSEKTRIPQKLQFKKMKLF
jgi:hypothetical protein